MVAALGGAGFYFGKLFLFSASQFIGVLIDYLLPCLDTNRKKTMLLRSLQRRKSLRSEADCANHFSLSLQAALRPYPPPSPRSASPRTACPGSLSTWASTSTTPAATPSRRPRTPRAPSTPSSSPTSPCLPSCTSSTTSGARTAILKLFSLV